MSAIEQIKQAIEKLSPEDFIRLSAWIYEREQSQWDRDLDADSIAGKLDSLFNEAAHAQAQAFPPTK
jgi:hypothetical protein